MTLGAAGMLYLNADATVALISGTGALTGTGTLTVSGGGPDTRLAAFKKPEVIAVVEEIPRSPLGKVRRPMVRELLERSGVRVGGAAVGGSPGGSAPVRV